MIDMAIASMSINMKASSLQQAVQTSVIKKAMNVEEVSMQNMIQMLEQSIPSTDHLLDVRA